MKQYTDQDIAAMSFDDASAAVREALTEALALLTKLERNGKLAPYMAYPVATYVASYVNDELKGRWV